MNQGQDDQRVFEAALRAAVAPWGEKLTLAQCGSLYSHLMAVREANCRFNLTRVTETASAAVRHYADSLSLLAVPWLQQELPLRILDVGTGAGFPAVPLAVLRPHWAVVAIDGTGKKVRFLADWVRDQKLPNIRCLHARAPQVASQEPGGFDLIVLRAVTTVADGLRQTRSLLRANGVLVFYKTPRISVGELKAGARAAAKAGCRELTPVELSLPCPGGSLSRRLIGYAVDQVTR